MLKRAFEFIFIMNLDKDIKILLPRSILNFGHNDVIKRRDNDQDSISAHLPRFGALPRVDHEILADDGQVTCYARRNQIILMSLKIRRVGKDGKASCAASLIGHCMGGRIKICANKPLGRAGLLDLRYERDA